MAQRTFLTTAAVRRFPPNSPSCIAGWRAPPSSSSSSSFVAACSLACMQGTYCLAGIWHCWLLLVVWCTCLRTYLYVSVCFIRAFSHTHRRRPWHLTVRPYTSLRETSSKNEYRENSYCTLHSTVIHTLSYTVLRTMRDWNYVEYVRAKTTGTYAGRESVGEASVRETLCETCRNNMSDPP